MSVFDKVKKLEAMNQLIAMKATGDPEEFARKLSISKSTLFRLLNELKDLGAKIVYNAGGRYYEFKSDHRFFIGILPDQSDKRFRSDKGR